jgi:hypothetical protein
MTLVRDALQKRREAKATEKGQFAPLLQGRKKRPASVKMPAEYHVVAQST